MFYDEGCRRTRFFPKKILKTYELLNAQLCDTYGHWVSEEFSDYVKDKGESDKSDESNQNDGDDKDDDDDADENDASDDEEDNDFPEGSTGAHPDKLAGTVSKPVTAKDKTIAVGKHKEESSSSSSLSAVVTDKPKSKRAKK